MQHEPAMRVFESYAAFFLMILTLAMSYSWSSIKIGEGFHVYNFNGLNKDIVNVECKSKGDDIGGHAMPFFEVNKQYYFYYLISINFGLIF